MNKEQVLEEYVKLFSKLPKRLQVTLQEEVNLSINDFIDTINLYITSHDMNIIIPLEDLKKIIQKNQLIYTSNILGYAQESSSENMNSLLNNSLSDAEIIELTNNVLKSVYSIISKLYSSEFYDNYTSKLNEEVYSAIVQANDKKESLGKYLDKIKYIVSEVVSNNSSKYAQNAQNKLNNGYAKEINEVTTVLANSLIEENSVSVQK